MKDLVQELNKLGEEEFRVSPDFSQNIIKQIKRDNRRKKIIYVTSIASAACVLGLAVFLVNKSGKLASMFEAKSDSAQSMSTLSTNNAAGEAVKESTDEMYDALERKSEEPMSLDVQNETMQATEEAVEDKTYTKQYSSREYIQEIIDILKFNDFDIQDNETSVIIYSKDVAQVLYILDNFKDVEVGMSGDNIIVKLKN